MENNKPMSTLEQSMLDAIAIITKGGIDKAKIPVTIECTIVEIEDAGQQLYKVDYMSNIFTASSSSGSYNVGDVVYVHVPEGDLSKTKIIIGAVESTENLVEEAVLDEYVEISDNLLDDNYEVIEFCSYLPEEKKLNIPDSFKNYFKKAIESGKRSFLLSTKMKTALPLEQQVNGNYGIYLIIPIVRDGGNGEVEHTTSIINIDINNIEGNPYGLRDQASQKTQQILQEGQEFDDTAEAEPLELIAFCKDFIIDDTKVKENNIDIWIKDIIFKNIDYLTEEDYNKYRLTIKASGGPFFLSNSGDTKTLELKLDIKGKNSKIDERYDCYQFRKANILQSDPKYSQIAGPGQECLNDHTPVQVQPDGRETFQWKTKTYTYTVNRSDINADTEYMCILFFPEKEITIKGTITITNSDTETVCSLTSATGSTEYTKNVGNIQLVARVDQDEITSNDNITISQLRIGKDESTILSTTEFNIDSTTQGIGFYEQHISFPTSLVDEMNNISCTFYRSVVNQINSETAAIMTDPKVIGTAGITITTTDKKDWRIIIQNGDVLYKYDSNGNSPFVADYAYPYNTQEFILPLKFKVFKPDGTELTADERKYCKYYWLVPNKNHSLIIPEDVGIEVDKYIRIDAEEFKYKIEDIYNPKRIENYVILHIDFLDNHLVEEANIKIVKEGENGTNGSKYTGTILYNGKSYEDLDTVGNISKLCKLQLAYIGGKWYYNGGNGIEDNPGYAGDYLKSVGELGSDKEFNFDIKVYCNGSIIPEKNITESGTVYNYITTWSLFDSKITNPILEIDTNGKVKIKKVDIKDEQGHFIRQEFCSIDANSEFATFLRAEIKVGNESSILDKGEEKVQEVIYCYYPVEVTYIADEEYIIDKNTHQLKTVNIPYIADGYSKVVYASDGTNPQFDNTNPFRVDNVIPLISEYSKCYVYEQSGSKNFQKTPLSEDNIQAARPNTKFDNGDSNNQIKVNLKPADNKRDEIDSKIKILDNKINAIKNEEDNTGEIPTLETYIGNNGIISKFYNEFFKDEDDPEHRDLIFDSIRTVLDSYNVKGFLKARTDLLSAIEIFIEYIQSIKTNIKTSKNIDKYKYILTKLLKKREEIWQVGSVTTEEYDEPYKYVEKYIDNILNLDKIKINDEIKTDENFSLNFDDIELPIIIRKPSMPSIMSTDIDSEQKTIINVGYISPFDRYLNDCNQKLKIFKEIKRTIDGGYHLSSIKPIHNTPDIYVYLNAQNFAEGVQKLYQFVRSKIQTQAKYDFSYLEKYEKFKNLVSYIDTYNAYVQRLFHPEVVVLNPSQTIVNNPDLYISTLKGVYGDTYPLFQSQNEIYTLMDMVTQLFEVDGKNYEESKNYYIKVLEDIIAEKEKEQNDLKDERERYQEILNWYDAKSIVISRPIVMLYNRYEMANLMGQDGSKLYIDPNNEKYLLAPQIGAGKKEKIGTTEEYGFTGVVMGVRGFSKVQGEEQKASQTGIFAFHQQEQTYFLNAEDGSAIMGAPGSGQIIIDPRGNNKAKGLIYSYDYQDPSVYGDDGKPTRYDQVNPAGKGMLIDFTKPEIKFGSGYFSVDSDGSLTAQGDGHIAGQRITNESLHSDINPPTDGRLTLQSGGDRYIDGYEFSYMDINVPGGVNTGTIFCDENQVENPNNYGFIYLKLHDSNIYYPITKFEKTDFPALMARVRFTYTYTNPDTGGTEDRIVNSSVEFIDEDGDLKNAVQQSKNKESIDEIDTGEKSKGTIYSNGHNTLFNTTKGFYLSQDGLSIGDSIRIESAEDGKILVGRVNNKNKRQTISGDTERSYIAYGGDAAYSDATTDKGNVAQVYIGTDGISIGRKFSVDNEGVLTAYKGEIGGQEISKTELKADNILIKSTGSIEATNGTQKQKVNNDGSAEFTKVTITGGSLTLGNATIDESSFNLQGTNNSQSSSSGFSFGNGSLGGNGVSDTGLAFNTGSMSFGTPTGTTGGISCDSATGNVKISGTVYATAGVIGGCEINNGVLTVNEANISSAVITNIKASVISTITSEAEISFSGIVHANKLVIGEGSATQSNTFTRPVTINRFDSSGHYIDQVTVLATAAGT